MTDRGAPAPLYPAVLGDFFHITRGPSALTAVAPAGPLATVVGAAASWSRRGARAACDSYIAGDEKSTRIETCSSIGGMVMPQEVGVVDLMLQIPEGTKRDWYQFLSANLRDRESLEEYEFPVSPAQARLLVADRVDRVSTYRLDPFEVEGRVEGPLTTRERIYRYIVVPLHTIFPKPGELDNVVNYLFTRERTEALPGMEDDLKAERNVPELWRPIWTNLVFLTVILGATCLYVARKDF
jgi:hypothetical protein